MSLSMEEVGRMPRRFAATVSFQSNPSRVQLLSNDSPLRPTKLTNSTYKIEMSGNLLQICKSRSEVAKSHPRRSIIGAGSSTFPEASGIRSSRKGYSRSRTTSGGSIILSRCLSSSSSGSGFPSKSNTRQPGVSRRSR